MEDKINLLVAEILASCAVVHNGNASTSVHSAEVKAFHGLNELLGMILELQDTKAVRSVQPTIEKALKEVLFGQFSKISLSPNFYMLLGNIWTTLFNRGDSRNIMAIANDFLDHVAPKSTAGPQSKAAVFHCLGSISTSVHGRLLSGHLQETVNTASKLFKTIALTVSKPAENELRYTAIRAVTSGIHGSGSAGQSCHANILKLFVKAATDKSSAVREAVAEGFLILGLVSNGFTTVALDSLITPCQKGLEDSILSVKLAYAKSLGTLLAISVEQTQQTERAQEQSGASSEPASPDVGAGGTAASLEEAASSTNEVSSSSSMSKFSQMAQKSAASLRKAGFGAGSPSSRLRGFGFPAAFPGLSSRSRTSEGPVSYTLQSALDLLYDGFEMFSYDQVLKRSDSQQAQDKQGIRTRSHETRMGYVEAAIELAKSLQQNGDSLGHELILQNCLKFAVGLCDDSKLSALQTDYDRNIDQTFRVSTTFYFLGAALSSQLDESSKLELSCALLNACTHTESSQSRHATTNVRSKNFLFKRRSSRSSSLGSPNTSSASTNRPQFRYNSLFLRAALMEISCLLSNLGDASLALNQELDFQYFLPLLEHVDRSVQLEAANVLYVCSVTQPGYASRGILPLLQLIGLYQAEATIAFAAPGNGSLLETPNDGAAQRSLNSIDGLVCALNAFILSSTAMGRPKSVSAERFLKREGAQLPNEVYDFTAEHLGIQHQLRTAAIPRGSNSLKSGDLKMLPSNVTLALLGYAKSMISRQHDGAMTPLATSQVASCGWSLIGSLVTLGPSWCLENVNQLFQAWQASVEATLPFLVNFSTTVARLPPAKLQEASAESSPLTSSITCLQASIQALYSFVRCNQLLLQSVPSITRSVATIVEQIVQVTVCKSQSVIKPCGVPLLGLHHALFGIANWLPRSELRLFSAAFVEKLHTLAVSYIVDASNLTEEPHSLFASLGLIPESDTVLGSALPEVDVSGSVAYCAPGCLWKQNWRFELTKTVSHRFEQLMSAKILSYEEARLASTTVMMYASCNCSHKVLAVPDLPLAQAGDGQPSIGMVAPMDSRLTVRCMDSAISFAGTALAQILSDSMRDATLRKFVGELRNTSAIVQASILRKVLATLNTFSRLLADIGTVIQIKSAQWLPRAKGILTVALSSPIGEVRQSAAFGLALLSKSAGPNFGYSVVSSLRKKLEPNTSSAPNSATTRNPSNPSHPVPSEPGSPASPIPAPASPYFKASFVLVNALIRREAGSNDIRYLKNNAVYDMCKLTSQPVRTWALHSWQTIVDCVGIDVTKYVKPSFALLNAHLLAADGHPSRGGYGSFEAQLGTYISLARLANALVAGLGPELSREDMEPQKFLNIWDCLRQASDHPKLQFECIRLVQQFLFFYPQGILAKEQAKERIRTFLHNHILRMDNDSGKDLRIAALHTLFILVEKEAEGRDLQSSLSCGVVALAAYEMANRCSVFQDWVIPPLGSNGLGLHLLRQSGVVARAKEPLMLKKTQSGSSIILLSSSSELRLVDPSLSELTELRKTCVNILVKLVSLCQRELQVKDPTSAGTVEGISDSDLQTITCLTKWVRFFRAVMAGTVEQLEREELNSGTLGKDPEWGDDDEEEEDDEIEDEASNSKGANASPRAASEVTEEPAVIERKQLLSYLNKFLSKCSWETRTIAIEGLLEALNICSKLPVQSDLATAKDVLKKLQQVDQGQFVCMHLQELLTGASQSANGQVQSAEIPQVSILGYCALVQIVRMFAYTPDPHIPGQGILKQYEMQLAATLGPGLSHHSSPLIFPFASTLAVELISSGISSSVNRIVNLLLPLSFRGGFGTNGNESDDYDSDSDGPSAEMNTLSFQPSVQTELLLMRCVSLTKLFLFALGGTIGSHGGDEVAAVSKSEQKKRKKLLSTVRANIEKALARYLLPDQERSTAEVRSLDTVWRFTVADVGLLLASPDQDKVLAKTSTQLCEVEDAFLLFPVFMDSFWVFSRALALRPLRMKNTAMSISDEETRTLLLSNVQVLVQGIALLPVPTIGSLFSSIGDILANTSESSLGDVRGSFWEILDAISQLIIRVSKVIKGKPRPGTILVISDAVDAAFGTLSKMVVSKAAKSLLEDHEKDLDFALWHKIVETCIHPLQASIGLSAVQGFARTPGYVLQFNSHSLFAPVFESVEANCVKILSTLVTNCPEACKASLYIPSIAMDLVSAVACSNYVATILNGVKIVRELCADPLFNDQILESIGKEALLCSKSMVEDDQEANTNAELRFKCLLDLAWQAVLHLRNELKPLLFTALLEFVDSCLQDPLAPERLWIKTSSLSFIVRVLAEGSEEEEECDTQSSASLLSGLAKTLMIVLHGPDSLAKIDGEVVSVPGLVVNILAKAAVKYPTVVQFALLVTLSLAEGPSEERSEKTREEARKSLVELATRCQSQMKTVVQALPPQTVQTLQAAIRKQLATTA